MTEPFFSREERLVLAYLYKHGASTSEQMATHFGRDEYADLSTDDGHDMSTAGDVEAVCDALADEQVVRLDESKQWHLVTRVRALMAVASEVVAHGLEGVAHG